MRNSISLRLMWVKGDTSVELMARLAPDVLLLRQEHGCGCVPIVGTSIKTEN